MYWYFFNIPTMHILTEFEAVCVDFGKVRQPRNYVELRDR